jgi:hypothetical protein
MSIFPDVKRIVKREFFVRFWRIPVISPRIFRANRLFRNSRGKSPHPLHPEEHRGRQANIREAANT